MRGRLHAPLVAPAGAARRGGRTSGEARDHRAAWHGASTASSRPSRALRQPASSHQPAARNVGMLGGATSCPAQNLRRRFKSCPRYSRSAGQSPVIGDDDRASGVLGNRIATALCTALPSRGPLGTVSDIPHSLVNARPRPRVHTAAAQRIKSRAGPGRVGVLRWPDAAIADNPRFRTRLVRSMSAGAVRAEHVLNT